MKKLIYLLMAALMVLAAVSCEKNTKKSGPSVKTLAPTDVEVHSARLNARIYFSGTSRDGATYGFFWGTSEDAEGTYVRVGNGLDENNTYSLKLLDLTPETEYWFKAVAEIEGNPYAGEILKFTTDVSPITDAMVDLGIVMRRNDGTTYNLYWAKSNLCDNGLCANPEDFGDYYAWGETEAKSNYDWSTYKWCEGTWSKLTKYITSSGYGLVDNIEELEPDDDAAHVILKGNWRMPTDAEWTTLREQCTWTWTTQNGVNGRLVTGKNNSGSIFLPAAGYMDGTNHVEEENSYSKYSSSSLYHNFTLYAKYIFFNSDYVFSRDDNRYLGLSVRPVYED